MSDTDNTKPLWLRRSEAGATAYNKARDIDYTDLSQEELQSTMAKEPYIKVTAAEVGVSRQTAKFLKRQRSKSQRRIRMPDIEEFYDEWDDVECFQDDPSTVPQNQVSGRGWTGGTNLRYWAW